MIKPLKENDVPFLYNPQNGKGICGVSLLSSAFHYLFDYNLDTKVHSYKQGYIECLSEQVHKKSNNSSSLKFLTSIMMKKELKNYYVHRKRKLISWKGIYQSDDCYESVFFVSLRATCFLETILFQFAVVEFFMVILIMQYHCQNLNC